MTAHQFLDVVDWLPDPMLLVSRDGALIAANLAARRLLGVAVPPSGELSIDALVDGDATAARLLFRESARSRQHRPGSLTLRGPDSRPMTCRCSAGLWRPATDNTPALVVIRLRAEEQSPSKFRVLTQRIEQLAHEMHRRQVAEAARLKLETQMLQTQKLESLGVLAGGIAHDFNNLLTGIIGYADLARHELPVDSAANEFLDEAVNGARRAAELTQQMLAYSGKGKFTIGPVVLSSLVTDIARLLEVSISKKCVLRFDLMADQPPCMADATQLRQVVMNLIINASEAIGDRSGVIALSTGVAWCERDYLVDTYLDESLKEGLYAHLEVADTGHGMSAETRARIFDPFFSTKFTGRGLGLAAVLGIVRGHGGAIRVYSEEGRGTTFKLLLPATPGDAATPTAAALTPPVWRGSGTVLIMEDEESIRALTRSMLERMGFAVVLASDGREGVDAFRRLAGENPLVLLDLTMPHLDGAAAYRELRRIRPDVRAILMSGYSEQSIASQFAGKGLAGFIQKPFRLAQLQQTIREVLAGRTVRIS